LGSVASSEPDSQPDAPRPTPAYTCPPSKQLGCTDGVAVLEGVSGGVGGVVGDSDGCGARGDGVRLWLGGRPRVTVAVPVALADGVCVAVGEPDGARYA
jgi:hypothetical protein